MAKDNQGTRTDLFQKSEKSIEPINTVKEAATYAGVSVDTAAKYKKVMALLNDEEWAQWSDREIARRCAVSNRFVSNLREEISVNRSQIETQTARKVERNGIIYTQNTTNIGKPITHLHHQARYHGAR